MVSIQDTDTQKLIRKTADELKSRITMPEWALYVKTGASKERPPEQRDWWQLRAASMLRRIYTDGPVGVSRLRTAYGGRHRRGHKPPHFKEGGGKVIRVILQQLEGAGLVQKAEKKKGRIITKEGQKFLNAVARQVK